jgi:predicted nucleotidyltransferase
MDAATAEAPGRRVTEGCRGALWKVAGVTTPEDREGNVSRKLRALAEEYAAALREVLGDRLVSVVLFGSVARGQATASSDIDILVVVRDLPRSRFARRRLLDPAYARVAPALARLMDEGIPAAVTDVIRTPEEAARPSLLYLDLTEDAVLLIDHDGFFAAVLDRMRGSLRRLGARRLWLDGMPYWDLKPDFRPGDVVELW